MTVLVYGERNIVSFTNEAELFEAIGYLASPNRNLIITSENYDNKWGVELRLNFHDVTNIPSSLRNALSAGNSTYRARLNCNDFVRALVNTYNFQPGSTQNSAAIRSTVPPISLADFDRGYHL